MIESMSDPQSDYDSPWKDILERFLRQFLQFFFPAVHDGIDWNREYTFLDKEFQKLTRDAEVGRRFADKLVQVYTRDGEPLMVMIHIEVQGGYEADFAKRMYVYNYRIYDRFEHQVISLAALTDDSSTWRPASFGWKRWGFSLAINFPMVKLLDYDDPAALESNPNPFAIITLAHLKVRETRKDPLQRFEWKCRITRALYERG